MKQGRLEPLSPETESLLASERNFSAQPAELRARVLARARSALGEIPAASSRNFWRRRAPLLVAAALVLAFAVAAIAARQELRRAMGQRPSVAPPAGMTRPAPAGIFEPASRDAEAHRSAPASELVSEPSEQGGVVPAPHRSPAGDTSDTDALELDLLQRARGAVATGEFSTALEVVAEHQRRFPTGRLREEREALRVKALAGLGRNDEARRAAERFRERYPRSVLSNGIEQTVRPKP